MNPNFKALLEKKMSEGKGDMSPVDKQASDSVLADLMHFLNDMQGEKVKGLKKVTVASNDPKGLEAGLAKAKDMVAGHDESSEDPAEEASETPEEEMMEDEDEGSSDDEHSEDSHESSSPEMSPEEMKKYIDELKAQLAAKG